MENLKMNISPELIISVIIQLVAIGIFIGVYKTTIAFMQQQIIELKEDMRKYNNILERMICVEQSTKSAHHRIDSLE
jgi:cell division protein FtsL